METGRVARDFGVCHCVSVSGKARRLSRGRGDRVWLDWKYALHLPLSYAGSDFQRAREFRQRFLTHEVEGCVFETLVQAFRTHGLIKSRGVQQTDSVLILTKVRDLSRLELVEETLRLAVRAVVQAAPYRSQQELPPGWEERYAPRFIFQRHTEIKKQDYEARIGADGQWLLNRLARPDTPGGMRDLPAVQVLRTVWQQHFQAVNGQISYKPKGHYDGHAQIQTPHDPYARYSRKQEFARIGDKVQVTETEDADYPVSSPTFRPPAAPTRITEPAGNSRPASTVGVLAGPAVCR